MNLSKCFLADLPIVSKDLYLYKYIESNYGCKCTKTVVMKTKFHENLIIM
jgi:hypothetical protein